MKRIAAILCLATLALSPACKDDSKDGESSGKATSGKSSEAITLQQLGIKMDAPKGASQSEMLGDIMVQAPDLVVSVGLAKDDGPKTIEAEKENAEMYGPKNEKSEKLDDGYIYTFENTGSMGKNYFVNARRTIDGKAYTCSTTGSSPKQRDNAIAACKSLRK